MKIKLSCLIVASCIACAPSGGDSTLLSGLPGASGTAANLLTTLNAPTPLSVLTYNVAGLPGFLSSSDPEENTPYIGPLLADYDVVHVQEDFNYHAALYAGDVHPHRTPTSGGVPFGDGINSLAYLPYMDFTRVKWNNCNGTDCLTPKGFSLARHRLAEGVYIDFYNLHPNASVEAADLAARRSNISQIAAYIDANSAGNAVVVMGDTNTRYTRTGDNIREITNRGFSDAWVEVIRGGSYPALGAPALTDCEGHRTDPGCEVVDKIFYRGNRFIQFTALEFLIEDAKFVHPTTGAMLSDHFALKTDFAVQLASDIRMSDQFGGPHGTAFTDVEAMPVGANVTRLGIRAGSRVDRVYVEYSNGPTLAHGGGGGSDRSLAPGSGEYFTSATLCSAQKNGHTRIFYANFQTNFGRSVSGGSTTSSCVTYTAPTGWQIAGFHGRSGSEVDRLGLIYIPQ